MTRRVHAFLKARGIPLASNQINFSLMYRKAPRETIDVCGELGVPVIAYFPLANFEWQSLSFWIICRCADVICLNWPISNCITTIRWSR